MAAETRLAAVLFGSFLLWLPALTAFLQGDLGAGAVGIRFAGAVAVTWGGIAVVAGLMSGYRTEPVGAVEDGGGSPRRRVEDGSSGTVPDPIPSSVDPSAVSDASDG